MSEHLADFMQIDPLDIFNFLTPKDRDGVLRARDLPYGGAPRQKLDIFGPRQVGKQALPAVIFFYGGSWDSGRKDAYGFVGRALAALGYVVVVPDYRLLPAVEYPQFLFDCVDAVRWVKANIAPYGGDDERLVLAGYSAGAYNAVMSVLDASLGLSVPIRGVAGLSGPYDFYPFDGPVSRRVFGQAGDGPATQPINHVRPGCPPMFLATGDDDRLVLPRNSDSLGRALERVGVDVNVRHYPGVDHAGTLLALSRLLRFRAPVLRDLAQFLRSVFAGQD